MELLQPLAPPALLGQAQGGNGLTAPPEAPWGEAAEDDTQGWDQLFSPGLGSLLQGWVLWLGTQVTVI